VLVGVSHVGICGTDFHIYEGKHPFLAYPRVMGHEFSGTVLDAAPGVALSPGQPVIVNPYLSCGRCIACRNGKANCCVAIEVLGVHRDGAMCEQILVPAETCFPPMACRWSRRRPSSFWPWVLTPFVDPWPLAAIERW
jgi:threonine dehydrogenase-like Zn-dependent dehydrogenase